MRAIAIFVLVGWTTFAEAQVNRYFVFFKDKANSIYSTSNPAAFLSAKSIARRQKQGVTPTEEDLPVNATYVQQVKATGAKTYFTSKWWNGVLVQTDAATLSVINALPFVTKTELVAPGQRLLGGRVARKDGIMERTVVQATESTELQLAQISLDKMQALGYRGESVDIAQFDSGWIGVNTANPFQPLFANGQVKAMFNFVTNTSNIFTADDHGTEVLSVMAAVAPKTFTGGVYKANFFLYLTEDVSSEYRVEEYNWTFAAEKADSAGVDVINSSLGYNTFDLASMDYQYSQLNGAGAVISVAAKKAVEKGIIVVTSAGNEGARSWRYITAPADVDGLLAVGAITSVGSRSSFSSFGPTSDNRIKPDVVALGSGVFVITSVGSVGGASGTSLASPLIASLAAGLVQAHPKAKPSDIVTAILQSADQYSRPDNVKGYGIPSFQLADQILKIAEQEKLVEIYPTWVIDDYVLVTFREPMDNVSIRMFDVQGKTFGVTAGSVDQQNLVVRLDASILNSGLYLVRVETPKGSYLVRLVKAK